MKWFKHMNDASRDEKITDLFYSSGHRGVCIFWMILEILSEQMDDTHPPVAIHPCIEWARLLKLRWMSLRNILEELNALGLIRTSSEDDREIIPTSAEDHLRIECYNLLKLKEWTHKKSAQMSALEEEEEEEDKENKKRKAQPKVSPDSYFSSLNGKVEEWKKAYPNIDVGLEIEKMKAWLSANPRRHKSNYNRFVINWLSRCKPNKFADSNTLGEWNALMSYVKSEGRYSQKPIPLTEKGMNSLRRAGGFKLLCDSDAFGLQKFKEKFFDKES